MGLETAVYVNGLVVTNPAAGDPAGEGDDHIRLLKSVLRNTFPNLSGPITLTETEVNGILVTLAGLAPLSSPIFTGVPQGPTAAPGTITAQLATTAFAATVAAAAAAAIAPPTGSILTMALGAVPNGYLECDGQAVSRVSYAALFSAIGLTYGTGDGISTFNVPDFRGEFLRGWDNGKGTDPARTIGSFQADELRSHTHTYTTKSGTPPQSGSSTNVWNGEATTNTGATGGTETRPRNLAVMYCVKT